VSDECLAGCCPHDSAGPGTGCPGGVPGAPLSERLVHLRNCRLLPVNKVAAVTGTDREFVTRLLYEAADWAGSRRPREYRAPAAQQVFSSRSGPSEVELLTALYADSEVRLVLDRHAVPVVNLARSAWLRYPAPQPLTVGLVSDLYEGCGLSLHHIELLTGRPAAAAGALLRASGIKMRPAGGRSPFTERWRPGKA
jgi:hypothetical protein